jgi:hypothetical protein
VVAGSAIFVRGVVWAAAAIDVAGPVTGTAAVGGCLDGVPRVLMVILTIFWVLMP